ncbi:MAG: 16S rRNA (guanine(966)-N(2))-methyltransferase RsmD [Nitrospirota bacterium]|nr:16S rRNA (guanine(966)-N(2))-methyltransferase RsmD [Nitrospirota bacterium]
MSTPLRITGGSARSLGLQSVPGQGVRPTASRVRGAIFNILGGRVAGARVLDLFAGVGTLGLEALSRGAAHADFVECVPRHADRVVENATHCGFEGRYTLFRMDAERFLTRRPGGQAPPFDVVFLDPPYGSDLLDQVLPLLAAQGVVAAEGVVVVEHEAPLPAPALAEWEEGRTYQYGRTAVTLVYPRHRETASLP